MFFDCGTQSRPELPLGPNITFGGGSGVSDDWWVQQVFFVSLKEVQYKGEESASVRYYALFKHGSERFLRMERMALSGLPELELASWLDSPITAVTEHRQRFWTFQPDSWLTYHNFSILEIDGGRGYLLAERVSDKLEIMFGEGMHSLSFMREYRSTGQIRAMSRFHPPLRMMLVNQLGSLGGPFALVIALLGAFDSAVLRLSPGAPPGGGAPVPGTAGIPAVELPCAPPVGPLASCGACVCECGGAPVIVAACGVPDFALAGLVGTAVLFALLVFYDDDDVWHERLLLYPIQGLRWYVLTPDGDEYGETLRGDITGPSRIRRLGPNYATPGALYAGAYRFKDYPDDDEMRGLIRRGHGEAVQECAASGQAVAIPTHVLQSDGTRLELDAYFGGHFIARRLTRAGARLAPVSAAAKAAPAGPGLGPAASAADVVAKADAGGGLGPVALWRSQLDVHAGTPGPVGTVWLASEPLGGLVLGQEVTLNSVTDVIFGSHTALALRKGLWVKCELLREADAPEYSDMRKKLFGATTPLELLDSHEADNEVELRNRLLGKKMPELRAEEGVSVKEESSEVRTLWVDYDAHGERHKAWREVVRESSAQVYADFPLEGPPTCLHLIRHIERTGGDPRLWLQIWLRAKKLEESDRVAHEMKVLVDVLYYGGIYDQLNMPALISMEVVCRRLQLVVEAYANPARPSWENARLYASQASTEEIISPAFKSWAAKRNKEEAEIASARTRARDLRGGGALASEEAVAAAQGGMNPEDLGLRAPPGPEQERPRGRPRWARRARDIYPLPVLEFPFETIAGSRSEKRRLRRGARLRHDCREALHSLNWLAGFPEATEASQFPPPDGAQMDVLQYVEGLVKSWEPTSAPPTPEAALKRLLKGRADYSAATDIALASYQSALVSMPDDLHSCPQLEEVLPAGDVPFLKEYSERMLRSSAEYEQKLLERPGLQPFTDPVLKHNRKLRHAFVLRLHNAGYLQYTLKPRDYVGCFFVWKSNRTKQRLILDARLPNLRFRDPPGVDLCSAESFSRIEVELDSEIDPLGPAYAELVRRVTVALGLADVKDCFHRCRWPQWLAEYFCLDAVPAGLVGLGGTTKDGRLLSECDMVYPCAGSLVMGFTWSLFFAQRINEYQASLTKVLRNATLISDRGACLVFSSERPEAVGYFVYVDNLGVLCQRQDKTQAAMDELDASFGGLGLDLHGGEVTVGLAATLGCELDTSKLQSRCQHDRYWRVKQGINGVLRRGRASGRTIEAVVGHATFCSLTCRRTMCVWNVVYKFISSNYDRVARLWPSVVEELRCFAGLMPFLVADWARPWNDLVSASDASEVGYGVSTAKWPRAKVAAVGRVLERSRFRRTLGHSARESALTAAGFERDEDSNEWKVRSAAAKDTLLEAGWELQPDFPEVPAAGLRRELWQPRIWGAWNRTEGILTLEARVLVKSLRRVALSVFGRDVRQRSRELRGSFAQVRQKLMPLPLPSTLPLPDTARAVATLEAEPKRHLSKQPPKHRGGMAMLCEPAAPAQHEGKESTSSGSDSSGSEAALGARKEQVLKKRTKHRLVKYLARMEGQAEEDGLTFLEQAAIGLKVRQQYTKDLQAFLDDAARARLPLVTDGQTDEALVKYFNKEYLAGSQAHLGNRVMAAFLDRWPEFGRLGKRKTPRAWRALKGWRRLTPGKSRKAHALPVWAAITWRMIVRQQVRMGIFNLVQVSTYARPGELICLTRSSLIPPTQGVTKYWSLLLSPEEKVERSKTGSSDDSLLLDSPWLQWLGPALHVMKQGPAEENLWGFDYPQYVKQFRNCCQDLQIHVVPYQARHSGPSIDRARVLRTQDEVQKRGRWASRKSLARYEKAARLASTYNQLSLLQRTLFQACEDHIEAIVLGRAFPELTLPPAIGGQ
ncbi:unnamed protein product [Polarella glacialis]|uniref:Uncharacterized protein n=1 Tax=Polarella glacialis TaxID=89957 RepID=A0A813K977_POLGL|nr:unnamed protein product [Polarella glacialis]